MKRYHPVLVTLHWLLAALVLGGLVMGGQVLAKTPNTDPAKLFSLKMHMSIGIVILVLMLLRLVIRFATQKPPHADIGNDLLNKGGVGAHYMLYAMVIAMGASGLAIANIAGLPAIVFFGSGEALPADFNDIAPRAAHGILALVLKLVIAAHVLAALYHQYVRKDSLFSRMWYGER
ncbi:cytochrome b [Profundibacter sp.]